jgi:DNA polymerase III delta prime subunit
MCLAREMLGDALLGDAMLELNASDDRGKIFILSV